MMIDTKNDDIINPDTNNPYICRKCKSKYHLNHIDFIGVTPITNTSMYLGKLMCQHFHSKYILFYNRDGEWIINRYFRPLCNADFTLYGENYYFRTNTHNIPFTFFRINRSLFGKKDNTIKSFSIVHHYPITEREKLIEASKLYYERINNQVKYTKQNKWKRKKK